MTSIGILQILVFFGLILLLTKPVGLFMSHLFQGERTFLHPIVRPLERLVYRLCGVREDQEQRWTQYAASLLAFSFFAFLFPYALMRLQGWLPLNPQKFGAAQVSPDQAFNTAVSFMTNTNWQSYTGESTMSYLVQMAALAVQNFASAAAGIAVAIALIRGFARHETDKIGNFWVDLTRTTLYVLIPISAIAALVLVSQGAIQNFHPYTVVKTVEGATQTIAQGPVASQEAIKKLGTNGGGFFNANSAHPFENPTPLHEPGADAPDLRSRRRPDLHVRPHGEATRARDGRSSAAMAVMFFMRRVRRVSRSSRPATRSWRSWASRAPRRPRSRAATWKGRRRASASRPRRSSPTVTTDASCGAVNSMHDSFTPLGGLVPLFNMQTDEVIFGGVGSGLYGMLLYAILGVFIAGLMVGRTPEYIGKKIQQKEVKMAMFAILATSFLHPRVLRRSASSSRSRRAATGTRAGPAIANLANGGPHGFSEMLYAYTSADREQRQRVRRHHGQHAVVQPDARPRDAVRALPVHDSRRWRSPAAWRARRSDVPTSAARCPRTARCSSACSSRRSSSSAR